MKNTIILVYRSDDKSPTDNLNYEHNIVVLYTNYKHIGPLSHETSPNLGPTLLVCNKSKNRID